MLPVKLDIAVARRALTSLRAIDLRSAPIDEIDEALGPLFTGYKVAAPQFNPGLRLFRARVSPLPTHVQHLLHPPPHLTPLGRCNPEGAPLLYCANTREAAYFEMQPERGCTLVVSEWRTTQPLLVSQVGYVNSVLVRMGTNRPQLDRLSTQFPDDVIEVASYLAELFTEHVLQGQEYRYKLTAAIAAKLLYGDTFDGLMYPTIAMHANADNFALKPSYVPSLEFVKAEAAVIQRVDINAFRVTLSNSAQALMADGTIHWNGYGVRWEVGPGRTLRFGAHDGGWVAHDLQGSVVDHM